VSLSLVHKSREQPPATPSLSEIAKRLAEVTEKDRSGRSSDTAFACLKRQGATREEPPLPSAPTQPLNRAVSVNSHHTQLTGFQLAKQTLHASGTLVRRNNPDFLLYHANLLR